MRYTVLFLGFVLAGSASALAQSASSLGDQSSELIKPQELRSVPTVRKTDPYPHPAKTLRQVGTPALLERPISKSATKTEPVKDDPAHPVDFGVHMHGGANDPHFFSPTSASPDGQEAGNAVTAGVKFGF